MPTVAHRRLDGFTLLELMVVVTIVGVLAALAVPVFYDYVQRSRVAEATTFLAEIKARQESYRGEFGRYCDVSGDESTLHPDTTPGINSRSFAPDAAWNTLGAAPDGPVRFSYSTYAGDPNGAPAELGFTMTDFWFVAHAEGDLDEDGTRILLEAYSAGRHVWIDTTEGWE